MTDTAGVEGSGKAKGLELYFISFYFPDGRIQNEVFMFLWAGLSEGRTSRREHLSWVARTWKFAASAFTASVLSVSCQWRRRVTCCVSHVIYLRESPPRFNRTVGLVHLLVDGLYVVEAHNDQKEANSDLAKSCRSVELRIPGVIRLKGSKTGLPGLVFSWFLVLFHTIGRERGEEKEGKSSS